MLVNGNASGLARLGGLDALWHLVRSFACPVQLVVTESQAALERAWPADPARRVILVGGDGSVHAAANLPGAPREVAVIPAGRANNVARSLGVPLDPGAAIELALFGEAHPIDLIEATTATTTYRVVEGLSVGFLAAARTRFVSRNSAAVVPALRAGAQAFRTFRPLGVRVSCPNVGAEDLQIAQLFVANLPLYEFGLRVAPQVDPRDGELDFVAIEARGRRSILPMIARLRRGSHLGRSDVHVWRAPGARVIAHGCSPIVADSTDLGSGTVVLRPLPGALRIVTPPPA